MKRYEVHAKQTSGWGMGPTTYPNVERYHTLLGADFARRFRIRYFHFGTMQTTTWIERDGEMYDFENAGRLFRFWDRRIIPTLYFVRSRWDGIRYGKNRDSMWSD